VPSYSLRAIVLKKTKLGETDLIFTLLALDGRQVRGVAKGARKPASSFAARLELYSVVDLLMHTGRQLDIISEARIVDSNKDCRADLEHTSFASVMVDLLDKTTSDGDCEPILFPLTVAALAAAGRAPLRFLPFVTAAHLLKVLAVHGLRPALSSCAYCGEPLSPHVGAAPSLFTFSGGGRICVSCSEAVTGGFDRVDARVLSWVQALIGSTFEEIEVFCADLDATCLEECAQLPHDLLRFCESWLKAHLDIRLKTLAFCFQAGLV
jgi:DNA repair protein RecO (recombination protein O)